MLSPIQQQWSLTKIHFTVTQSSVQNADREWWYSTKCGSCSAASILRTSVQRSASWNEETDQEFRMGNARFIHATWRPSKHRKTRFSWKRVNVMSFKQFDIILTRNSFESCSTNWRAKWKARASKGRFLASLPAKWFLSSNVSTSITHPQGRRHSMTSSSVSKGNVTSMNHSKYAIGDFAFNNASPLTNFFPFSGLRCYRNTGRWQQIRCRRTWLAGSWKRSDIC